MDNPIDLTDGRSRASIPVGAFYMDPAGNVRVNQNRDKGNPIVKRAAGQPAAKPAAGPQGGPQVGQVVKGYRFKGGDPANPQSWVKQ